MPLFGPPNVQKLIDKRDLKKLAATLADGDSGTRDQAAQGLIQIGDPEAVPYIVDVIRAHQDQPVIDAAVRVLQEMSGRAMPVLAAGLVAGRLEERAAYAGLLGHLGPIALPPLLEASSSQDPEMRAVAAMGLGLVDAPEARSRLDSLVTSDGSLEVRGYAGFAMASHKVSGACETLLGQLGSDDAGSRGMAATNLGVLGDPRAAERLRELADGDPDQRVRDAAGKALASLPG
jgi:HEAT repeat protein